MTQSMTVKIKLEPTKSDRELIRSSSLVYIATVNSLVSEMVSNEKITKKSSKDINVSLNSAVKNQAIRDAKSVFQKAKKSKFKKIPVLKKPVIIWNNQNFTVCPSSIRMPFVISGTSKKIEIPATISAYERSLLNQASKVGTLRITKKGNKYIAQISIEISERITTSVKTMGVDLGIKIPAVCCTDEHEVKFAGNGRMNKYVRRYHNSRRKELGHAKKLNAIKKSKDKEQRWMKDQDHKISREIIDFAINHNVGMIRLEKLANIRKQTRKSRKNNHSLSNWSFYRLASYIEYKAYLVGIKVEYVHPAYTSQRCPDCGHKHHAKDRRYHCTNCGYVGHRDVVGAKNIIYAPVLDGKSQVA
ncbi:transposase [Enterococcus sp. DIV1298c]|uniref:RNA-guided endonuclease InsQ/TnpB family protein n=1 Tax=Enterococcus sp. DIV1298c TaxID=2815328 RepID=UPI001A922C6D|nr:RNA-guided endonuclease TnpB family protein [Enterococcus sp. DIV1298c]MBO0462696.1 transposase [Enterococcus sp. DIV1298c]